MNSKSQDLMKSAEKNKIKIFPFNGHLKLKSFTIYAKIMLNNADSAFALHQGRSINKIGCKNCLVNAEIKYYLKMGKFAYYL